MSKRANPTAIGLFMIGAMVLAVIGIGTFVSAGWFQNRPSFISYFEESVNGLESGAAVKFKGVPVGQVKEIRIRVDLDEKTFRVPVIFDINLDRIDAEQDGFVDLSDPRVLQEQIQGGLRAQLQMESFVTGLLYVELTYVSDPEPPSLSGRAPFPEIPTEPSFLSSFGQEAGSLVAGLQSVDIGSINRHLMSLLIRANQMLEELDVQEINRSLVETSRAFEELARSPAIRQAFEEIPGATAQFGSTMEELQLLVQRLGATIDPLQLQLSGTNEEVVLTLQALRRAISDAQVGLSTESGIGYDLQKALNSLSEAADALRMLATTLERNPDMLIKGKAAPENQK